MEYPNRKTQRLKDFDYSQNNAYFITVCTQNQLLLFGKVVSGTVILNNVGKMVAQILKEISEDGITVEKSIVMPNHIHSIIRFERNGTAQGPFPTLSELVRRFKTLTTKLYIDGVNNGVFPPFDKKIWQKSFYDHIIRDEKGYLAVWRYIDENPLRWAEDEYYILND